MSMSVCWHCDCQRPVSQPIDLFHVRTVSAEPVQSVPRAEPVQLKHWSKSDASCDFTATTTTRQAYFHHCHLPCMSSCPCLVGGQWTSSHSNAVTPLTLYGPLTVSHYFGVDEKAGVG